MTVSIPLLLLSMAVLLLSTAVTAKDQSFSLEDTTVDILGQSGKMSISIGGAQSQVSVTSVKEVDVNGVPVGCTGQTKHCVNSFGSQTFTFSAPTTGFPIGDTSASTLVFTSVVPTGVFSMTTMIVDKDGSITNRYVY
jgi:hypothetical protein